MRVSIEFDFFKPIFYVGECFSASNIVYKECSDGTSVVGSSDGTKVFLACSIPNLKFDPFVLDGDGFGSKLNTHSNIMGIPGLIFDELENNAGFANSGVPYYDELIKVMVRIHYRK